MFYNSLLLLLVRTSWSSFCATSSLKLNLNGLGAVYATSGVAGVLNLRRGRV